MTYIDLTKVHHLYRFNAFSETGIVGTKTPGQDLSADTIILIMSYLDCVVLDSSLYIWTALYSIHQYISGLRCTRFISKYLDCVVLDSSLYIWTALYSIHHYISGLRCTRFISKYLDCVVLDSSVNIWTALYSIHKYIYIYI